MQYNIRSDLDNSIYQHPYASCKKELDHLQNYQITPGDHCLQLPLLEDQKLHSPCNFSMPVYGVNTKEGTSHSQPSLLTQDDNNIFGKHEGQHFNGQLTDWRVLDNSVVPQLLNQGISSSFISISIVTVTVILVMDILKEELLKKRQSLSEETGGRKVFKRSEIEHKRIQKRRREEKQEADAKRLCQNPNGSSSNPNLKLDSTKSKPESSAASISNEQSLDLPKQEVIRRLRLLKQPVTLFGESDGGRLDRLHAGSFESEGQRNDKVELKRMDSIRKEECNRWKSMARCQPQRMANRQCV
ncbi:hypothetical protein E3N88_03518 [Mikania micrantha]|uniref:Pre-mRNA processing factor 4 (PRP4)-like domain-containing protein n=1 Tax=Mikania micrantha TaxID=192012 RepID=A0A5N6Q6Y5_9ASTR|nr:hypothetical protein E3N88_03518 [Mikania micrantha]